MQPLNRLVERARNGDLDAFAEVVRATGQMAFALACGVLRDSALAQVAMQRRTLPASGGWLTTRSPQRGNVDD